eukprot:CAMPEP_0206540498 /NCGR_PEP_ID=MMETSP0325_2-20121206/9027_1 /ASSEMBLY_ACC=CAM_ASM_000347 /TAXON_ID=2866 /ORGANISM="Crypthecodinium cohnii, Strain Seligo" /LENGTH=58 /DNA_ID=CAMNT_0054038205 /DNA_START=1123 /DNA_END=1296 /DNA_ORIENTATION=+
MMPTRFENQDGHELQSFGGNAHYGVALVSALNYAWRPARLDRRAVGPAQRERERELPA